MDLKMRQELVQTCGTITAFNYAYCKILHDQLYWLLKSDIVDGNGEEFVIFRVETGEWVRKYQDRFEATEEALSKFDSDVNEEQTKTNGISDYQKIRNASHLNLREGSLLPVLVEHLAEQTKIKECIHFSHSGFVDLAEVRAFSNEIDMFFSQVKEFLAMFEQSE